jgi:Predicted dehydrogenases and related proteins
MIGAASIGPEALLEPAARRHDVRVLRVAARRAGAADDYARAWNVPRASADYEDVLADRHVQAVYIANAASDHARWTMAALQAGKHVLCEKPIAVSGREARAIVDAAAATGRVVMKGFHYRFHPLFRALQQLVRTERFGGLVAVRSVVNGRRMYDPASILHVAALGGGSLLHNGVYAVHWSRLLFDAEPIAVRARQRRNASGADSETIAELQFPGGRKADVHCSFDRDDPVSVALTFPGAEVAVTGLIGPHHGHSLRIMPTAGPSEVTTVAGRSSFDYQLEEFLRRVGAEGAVDSADTTIGRGDDIAANSDVIDAIRQAAATGNAEKIGS